jgi:polyisoprenoid-binding protein YceI
MDFHPYRDADGKLFVSTAIYSGFNCVDPAFVRFDEPLSGTWTDFEDVFRNAGRLLEDQVAQLVVSSTEGDAFDPVRENVPAPSWTALGLALPAAPPVATGTARRAPATRVPLPARFRIEEASANDPPRLEFRFAPPLDTYNGEVRTLTGTITIGGGGSIAGATATIEAATSSVTMGDKTLDSELRDKILRVARFPRARFTLDPLSGPASPIAFGSPVPFTGAGRLEMLGESVPIAVNAQAEAMLADDGTPRLDVRATFRLRIGATFGLTGPDGPSPANDTLVFAARFRLKPY